MVKDVANSPISNSYVGLLRISDDRKPVSVIPAPVYTSDGTKTVLSLGTSSAVINGSLTAEYLDITNTTTTNSLAVVDGTIFGNTITFTKVSTDPGVINDTGVIFENRGTFKSTGTIISEGNANFTTLTCTEDVSIDGNFTVGTANISISFNANKITLNGAIFNINTTNTTFSNPVIFNSTVNLGSYATATTPPANDNSTKVATTAYVNKMATPSVPVGTILPFAGQTPPTGYFLCDGRKLKITEYQSLFNVIGYAYSTSTSGTNFAIPDLRGVFLRGYDAGRNIDNNRRLGTLQPSGAPNITGKINADNNGSSNISGAFYLISNLYGASGDGAGVLAGFDASRCSNVYEEGLREVRPVNVAINYIIKY